MIGSTQQALPQQCDYKNRNAKHHPDQPGSARLFRHDCPPPTAGHRLNNAILLSIAPDPANPLRFMAFP